MTKTFCDRCGKEITKEYGWLTHRTLYASIRLFLGRKHEEWSERDDQYICPECEDSYIRWFENEDVPDRLKDQPKIVRCKDCVFRDDRDGICEHVQQVRDPDWYCADGERR